MAIKKRDFQKLVNFVKELQGKLPSDESTAELRDALNFSLLHMHKYYKKIRIRNQNTSNAFDGIVSLTSSLTGGISPVSPYIAPLDKFDWKWINLDVNKLSASFGHGDKNNFVPEIFYVVKDCDIGKMKEMLQNDQDLVNEVDAIGRTTAMYAVHGGSQQFIDCLNLLIENGVDLKQQGNDGFTCLHIASYYGYQEAVEILLKNQVEVNVKDADGRTPLHWAAAYSSSAILKLLIVDGADPNVQDNDGLTPAMWACHFDQLENLQLLLAVQDKSDPTPEARFKITDATGRTILHWAVSRMANIDCVKYLVNTETVNLCDDDGKTIFLCAAEHGCLAACTEILNICADDIIEDVDSLGRTALHLAAISGHGETVDLLLSRGAVADRLDNQGATPMDYVNNKKLHYCILVFTSYQRYKERLRTMHATLTSPADVDKTTNEDQQKQTTFKSENFKGQEDHNDIEDSDSHKSMKLDVQDAVGFEIEGDVEYELDADDIEEIKPNDEGEEKRVKSQKEDFKKGAEDKCAKIEDGMDGGDGSKIRDEDEMKCRTTEDPIGAKEDKTYSDEEIEIEARPKHGVGENETYVLNSNQPDQIDVNEIKREETKQDKNKQIKDEISIEESSIDNEMIVLVAHHGSDDDLMIEYGNEADELEKSDKADDSANVEDVASNEFMKPGPSGDRDLYETSRLSPRIESVTGLMETNTIPANQSASVNMSVSSLGSDSEEEILNERQGLSKLDTKIPPQSLYDGTVNQIEYRSPFPKQRLQRQPNTRNSSKQTVEEERPTTSHGKRKDKKNTKKDKKTSPRSKTDQGIPENMQRIPVGPLEPMKPLKPLIAPSGFSANRGNLIGNQSSGTPTFSPSSPRGSSFGFSNPSEIPVFSKGNQLPTSPRLGFEGRDSSPSHIPRPSSPLNRESGVPVASGSFFPRPPLTR